MQGGCTSQRTLSALSLSMRWGSVSSLLRPLDLPGTFLGRSMYGRHPGRTKEVGSEKHGPTTGPTGAGLMFCVQSYKGGLTMSEVELGLGKRTWVSRKKLTTYVDMMHFIALKKLSERTQIPIGRLIDQALNEYLSSLGLEDAPPAPPIDKDYMRSRLAAESQ